MVMVVMLASNLPVQRRPDRYLEVIVTRHGNVRAAAIQAPTLLMSSFFTLTILALIFLLRDDENGANLGEQT